MLYNKRFTKYDKAGINNSINEFTTDTLPRINAVPTLNRAKSSAMKAKTVNQ